MMRFSGSHPLYGRLPENGYGQLVGKDRSRIVLLSQTPLVNLGGEPLPAQHPALLDALGEMQQQWRITFSSNPLSS